jgi:hypothetical protein
MAVTVNGSVLTQTDATSASPSTLTFTSTVLTAGDVVVIAVTENNVAEFVTPAAPTGGTGLSWTSIINQQNTAAHFSQTWAYWTKVPSDQTSTITVTTTSTSNLGTMAALWRLSGVDQVTPVGLTDGFQGQTDPTGTDLQLSGTLAGSMIFMVGSDWSAGTAARTITISNTTGGVTDFDNLETSQFRGIFARGAQSSSTNQGTLDYTAATGDWAAVIFEIEAAAAGGGLAPFRPGKTWKRRFKHRQQLPTPPVDVIAAVANPPEPIISQYTGFF